MQTIFEQACPIGAKEVVEAQRLLKGYQNAKRTLESRIVENEQWYQMRQGRSAQRDAQQENAASAWLFNSLANKHADAMDNYPAPVVLPREANDQREAEMLSSILPVILEQNDYERTYSEKWWAKLKHGTAVEGVFWNPSKLHGLGDIDIRRVDLLNLFWEPGITDIQQSRNLFHVALYDNDELLAEYPQLKEHLGQGAFQLPRYAADGRDRNEQTAVVDWYYKRRIAQREVLHYCKFGCCLPARTSPRWHSAAFTTTGGIPLCWMCFFPWKARLWVLAMWM